MRKEPFFIAWKMETDSAAILRRLADHLRTLENLNAVFTDRILTLRESRETIREQHHTLHDYFDRLCVLPSANGDRPALRLFFQRKPQADRSWKDVMASVLKQASQLKGSVWIGLAYRVDDEQLYAAAARVPKWFARLRHESQSFWRISANYLLKHPRFTLADLERDSGIPVDALKAMYDNSYRVIRGKQAPNPLWVMWDYSRGTNVYKMEPVVRDEILCLTKPE